MTFSIRRWLDAAGFGRYADQFESHEIDKEALICLNEAHLKELGIGLGPRLKLLKAIEEYAADEALFEQAGTCEDAPALIDAKTYGERRQLTVMFIDLVGATVLSDQLDPEDLRSLITAYQAVVDEQIRIFDGHVAQYLGDGVLAYFGYPTAHEDDPERAVRAALAILGQVSRIHIGDDQKMSARIGVATGLVVIGEKLGSGSSSETLAIGNTPNIAARLQQLASPGQMVLSQETRRLIGGLFDCEDLGLQTIKGITTPQRIFAIVGERLPDSRFDAKARENISDLVGRQGELATLQARWNTAIQGEGQAVVVVAAPGVGKSRIVRALRDTLTDSDCLPIHYQCSPYHTGSPLFPIIRQLAGVTNFRSEDSTDEKLDRLQALLGGDLSTPVEDVQVIASLLGVDGSRRFGDMELTAEQQRPRIFAALIRQIVRLSGSQPVLMVIEDAHWIDPSSLEMIDLFLEQLPTLRAMLVITTRPTEPLVLGGRGEVLRISLTRLARSEITEVIKGVTGGKSFPTELMQEISVKSDGVPLFAEELTKLILESNALSEADDGSYAISSPEKLRVPASLHDSLMARLDGLQAAKGVAQTAACIGRQFDYDVLLAITDLDDAPLIDALTRLTQADLISCRGIPPQASYIFRHALMRDAAYESLLKSTRQDIHSRLLDTLGTRADASADLFAHHATEAGAYSTAIDCWQKAAVLAMARPAYAEALAHLQRALKLVTEMGGDAKWLNKRLQILLMMGQASIPLRGYGHAETTAFFTQAEEQATEIPSAPHRFTISYALWVARYIRGEQDQALAIGKNMVKAAEVDGVPGHLITALRSLAISQMITGSPDLAERSFQDALDRSRLLIEPSREKRLALAHRFAAEPGIATQFHFGFTRWALGKIGQAQRQISDALDEARSMQHAHTLGHALAHAAIFSVLCRDTPRALELSAETITYAEQYELEMWTGYGQLLSGYAHAQAGEPLHAVSLMESGFGHLRKTQTHTMVTMFHAMQARTLASLQRFAEARQHVAIVQSEFESGSERYFWPECYRLLGETLASEPETDPVLVREAYQKAMATAQDQGARPWELYSGLSLGQWLVESGEQQRAIELLTPLRDTFVDGQDLSAFKDVQLLIELIR